MPPLRDRREDIPPLVHSFLVRAAARMKKDVRTVSAGDDSHDLPEQERAAIERALERFDGNRALARHAVG